MDNICLNINNITCPALFMEVVMNKKVLIVSFSFEQEEEAFQVLRDGGYEPVLLAEKDRAGFSEDDLAAYWKGLPEKPAGIIMGADIALGEKFASQADGLKAISLNCAGYDHLDLAAFQKRNIIICNVPRQNFEAVADFAWGMIICVMRRIAEGDRAIRSGKWCKGVERGIAVSGKTIGIIGFGAIGQAVAKRAMGFDMRILVSSTSRKPELALKYNAIYVDRETLFKEADIIIPTCPHVPETHHIINKNSIALMKKSAVVVNPSRGGIIDTEALYNALKEGRIAGAALDVYEKEPLYESKLFELENVVLTPHMGGLADREIHNVAMQSAYNMISLLEGKPTGSEIIGGSM